jgi:molecular chaperone DnaK
VEQSVTIQGASTLSESEVQSMLEEAEKYAAADKTKRENIDLKNQAETLCVEAEKELANITDSISEEDQNNVKQLITKIKQEIQDDNIESLKYSLENLKEAMRKMMEAKSGDKNSASTVNDL